MHRSAGRDGLPFQGGRSPIFSKQRALGESNTWEVQPTKEEAALHLIRTKN